jgi:hypothetical protein
VFIPYSLPRSARGRVLLTAVLLESRHRSQ